MKRKKTGLHEFADRQTHSFRRSLFGSARENQEWAVLAMEIQKLRRFIEQNYLTEAPRRPGARYRLALELFELATQLVIQPEVEGGGPDAGEIVVIDMEMYEDDEA